MTVPNVIGYYLDDAEEVLEADGIRILILLKSQHLQEAMIKSLMIHTG